MGNPLPRHLPPVGPSVWSEILSEAGSKKGTIVVKDTNYVVVDAAAAKESLKIEEIIHISKQTMTEAHVAKEDSLSSRTSTDLTEHIGHLTKQLVEVEKDKNPYSLNGVTKGLIVLASIVSIIGIPLIIIPWFIKSSQFNKQLEKNSHEIDRQLDTLRLARDFSKNVEHFHLIKTKLDRFNISNDFKETLHSLLQAPANQVLNKLKRVEDQLESFEAEFVLSEKHKQFIQQTLSDIKKSNLIDEDHRSAIEQIIHVIQSEIDPILSASLEHEMEATRSVLQGLIDHPEALQNIEPGTLVDGLRSIYKEFASLHGRPTEISYTLGRLLKESSMLEWMVQTQKELSNDAQHLLMQPVSAERDAKLLDLLEKGDHLLKGGQFMQEMLGMGPLLAFFKDAEQTMHDLIPSFSSPEVIKNVIQKGAKFNPDEGFRRAGGMMKKYLEGLSE